ncbi:hypothetical protein D9M72_475990 [compost metagenome]
MHGVHARHVPGGADHDGREARGAHQLFGVVGLHGPEVVFIVAELCRVGVMLLCFATQDVDLEAFAVDRRVALIGDQGEGLVDLAQQGQHGRIEPLELRCQAKTLARVPEQVDIARGHGGTLQAHARCCFVGVERVRAHHGEVLRDVRALEHVEDVDDDGRHAADEQRPVHALMAGECLAEILDASFGFFLSLDEACVDGLGFRAPCPEAFLCVAGAGAHEVFDAVHRLPVHATAHARGLHFRRFEGLERGSGIDVLAPGVVADVLEVHDFPYKNQES